MDGGKGGQRVMEQQAYLHGAVATVFGYAIWTSFGWSLVPRLYVLVVAVPGFLMSLVQLAGSVLRARRKPLPAAGAGDAAASEDPPWQKELRYFGLLGALVLGTWVAGFSYAAGLFAVGYLRFAERKRWHVALVCAVLIFATIQAGTHYLHLSMPVPLLDEWLPVW